MTTTSSCAAPSTGTSASRTAALLPFLTGDRLHAMKHFLLAIVFLFQLAAWAQPDAALLVELRRGGYVLYIPHTSTDFGQNDAKMTGYADCANQRNLTDKCRQEASARWSGRGAIQLPPSSAGSACRIGSFSSNRRSRLVGRPFSAAAGSAPQRRRSMRRSRSARLASCSSYSFLASSAGPRFSDRVLTVTLQLKDCLLTDN